ncbi:ASKHA domain-containing protein [Hippea sp. KM1]|uniref:ASKHA domain-containing protein n=1 Tax=Hippea sp. KM1 TaxID=944481 RepID=UPI00046CACA8|nr:ASKHA domain-containing protein [Hippea sp. KM1]
MKLTVRADGHLKSIQANKNDNLLKILHSNGLFINAYCGGKGICKKCIVRFLEGAPEPLKIEREALKDKIDEGYRLACLHNIENGATIEIETLKPVFSDFSSSVCCDDDKTHIAIDIGTTTIASAVVESKQITKSINLINPQIAFGGDVISRIASSNEGNFDILRDILKSSIRDIIATTKPASLVVCANPTMLSFFLGIDPKPIGEFPYTPPFTGSLSMEFDGIQTYIPPVIGAFVGSDITSALSILPQDEDFLFIDIGTNCEFILKVRDSYYSSSVPAGPALEGANIDYGSIAQDGAIYKVGLENGLRVYTINSKKPIGITGSGLISAIALLRRLDIIDKSGRLLEPWEAEAPFSIISRIKDEGFKLSEGIYLTQNSVRNFQLVKASLNAGVELLLKRVGQSMPDKIFIGGGFSKSLSRNEIIDSGLLSFEGEFVMLHNSSLAGGLRLFCLEERERVEELSKRIEYIEIANEADFERLYIEKMDF